VPHLPGNAARAEVATVGGVDGLLWRADEVVPAFWLQVPRDGLGEVAHALQAAGAVPGSYAVTEALRIEQGQPRLDLDVEVGTLPQEAGLVAALNFVKGCYLGQEAVAMLTYRGQLRRHLCWVDVLAGDPQPGDTLTTADGRRAGRMGSAFERADGTTLGLATVNRKVFAPAAELVCGKSACVRVLATTVPDALKTGEGGAA
jgi:folate-binding protein YgfZ